MKKRKDGRYCKKITLPDGTSKYFYSSAKTEREAVRDFNRQMLEYEQDERNKHTFAHIADQWNTEYRLKISDINYRKNGKAAYEYIVSYFGDIFINDLTAVEINIFIDTLISKGYFKKTIANYKSMVNRICQYAVLNGYIKYNPVNDIRLPNNLPHKKRELPSTEALKIVSEHTDGFDLLPFFMLYTGCRKSEALAIKNDNVDFNKKIITIRNHVIYDSNRPVFESVLKTEAACRNIILLDRLADVLPKNFTGFLFSSDGDGKSPLTKRQFDAEWKRYCNRYGVNITAHQLRHGYATMLFEAGVDAKDAQELMGHSDINLTQQIYTHVRSERKATTADKLNAFAF